MKAVQMTEVGGPEVLQLVELDEPGLTNDRQVKVRLEAAGVNPVDTKLRQRGVLHPDGLPAILGCDGAGIVTEVGAQVNSLKPGDAVWFCAGGLGGMQGNYAEYTVVEASAVRPKPHTLNFEESAAAPLVLIAAWEALYDRARLTQGQTVLIHGGAGGVGHVAIQLAKQAGAQVCTTVGSADKVEFMRELGAEEIILYRECDFVDAVQKWTNGRGVDVVLDTVGGEIFWRSLAAVAHYGDLVTLLDPGAEGSWKEARNRNLRISFELMLTPMLADLPQARDHQGEILERCAEWIDAGTLKIHVEKVLPLEAAAQAHQLLQEGHMRGKLVLRTSV